MEEKGASPEMTVFKDLSFFSGKSNDVLDEIEIINSRSNFIQVVRRLGTNVVYTAIGDIKKSEVYKETPIKVNFLAADSLIYQSKFSFFVKLDSKNSFSYRVEESDAPVVFPYGKNIETPIGDIIITPDDRYFNAYQGQLLKISLNPLEKVAQGYKNLVKISNIEEYSKIVNLAMTHPVPQKARDILNELVDVYNQNAVNDKKEIADRTFSFINERINSISSNLSQVDQSAQEFKTSRGLADIGSQANINLNIGAENQQLLENARTQLNMASSMKGIVDGAEDFSQTLPANIGLSDPSVTNATAKYNQLVQERKRLLKSSNEKNPMIVNIDDQLKGIKNSLQSSLNNTVGNLTLQVNNLSTQQSRINSKIYSAPKNERALRDITRKQETTEALYLFLLQRREESQVALASAAPKSRVIDRAHLADDAPVSPNKPKIYLAALVLGVLIPFAFVHLAKVLDNKIHNMASLEKLVKNYPVLAELPKVDKKKKIVLDGDSRSVLSESLRILRTNLDYLVKSGPAEEKNNVVLITSSVSGEGKTFVSSNLAAIFSSTGKKVLLIGADIRNPKIHDFFDGGSKEKAQSLGLSEYLMDEALNENDVIQQATINDYRIDIVYSGKIYPNPSELLMRERIETLLKKVSQEYDYVIVDSAPLMLVTDTLLITPYTNHTLYVTRADVTETKVVDFPIALAKEGKVKGLCFIVNDVKEGNLGYGGKYGYGYGIKTKKWWQFG
ncbi:GumC family protein [Sediminicola luteus]|uniref:GumC family protein n=1 Tax=Sediminicola luteus TaxID=319238 RepID=UPI001FE48BDC|nr:tyrosine-protein kinase [Sediminicola luteus]